MRGLVAILLAISAVLSAHLGLASPALYTKAVETAGRFLDLLGFRGDLLPEALDAVFETFVISLFGISLGGLLAFLLAPLSTPLVAPPGLSWAVRAASSAFRTIPAVLWAIFFVILVGPGPAAGALALALYTSTYLVKLFYEALEAVERELYDSLRAIGIRGLPLAAALFTHVRKQVVSHVLFMLEYNVRTATILGFVGAGGVGYYILQYLSILDYAAVTTYVVVTVVFVVAIDVTSYLLRRRI